MSRLLLHVEGQTEETFVNDVFVPLVDAKAVPEQLFVAEDDDET